MQSTWTPSDVSRAQYLGPIEFQDNSGNWQAFEVMRTQSGENTRIVFGSACNVGFLESGFIEGEESTDELLFELLADLEVFYNEGPQYVSRIVCNECM